jgi:hypothetical protein
LNIQTTLFYVITGGPGTGKTTVVAELVRRGYICIPEDARALIQEQSGSALPWLDAPRFAELLVQRSVLTYHAQAATWHARAAKNPTGPAHHNDSDIAEKSHAVPRGTISPSTATISARINAAELAIDGYQQVEVRQPTNQQKRPNDKRATTPVHLYPRFPRAGSFHETESR